MKQNLLASTLKKKMLLKKASNFIFNQLTFGKVIPAGRNSSGVITIRYRGGTSVSRLFRVVDFVHYVWNIRALVLTTQYDPNRTALINLLAYTNSILAFILAPSLIKTSSSVLSANETLSGEIRVGHTAYLKFIKPGVYLHALEFKPISGAKYIRSASNYAKLVSNSKHFSILKLRSKVLLRVNQLCVATLGILSNRRLFILKQKGAGFRRRLGRRPHVRGVAMNPIDHPHGGGQGKTSGGRPSVSPWAFITKGRRTRRKISYGTFILKR